MKLKKENEKLKMDLVEKESKLQSQASLIERLMNQEGGSHEKVGSNNPSTSSKEGKTRS